MDTTCDLPRPLRLPPGLPLPRAKERGRGSEADEGEGQTSSSLHTPHTTHLSRAKPCGPPWLDLTAGLGGACLYACGHCCLSVNWERERHQHLNALLLKEKQRDKRCFASTGPFHFLAFWTPRHIYCRPTQVSIVLPALVPYLFSRQDKPQPHAFKMVSPFSLFLFCRLAPKFTRPFSTLHPKSRR